MKNKRNILSIVAIMVLVVTFISTTYALFQAQGGSITEQLAVSADGSVNYYLPFETCTITSNGSARCY